MHENLLIDSTQYAISANSNKSLEEGRLRKGEHRYLSEIDRLPLICPSKISRDICEK